MDEEDLNDGLKESLRKLANALVQIHGNIREHSDRREREYDKVMAQVTVLATRVEVIIMQLQEARKEVGDIRDDITPIHGVALQRSDDFGKPERRRAPSTDDIKIPRSWIVAAMPVLKWVVVAILAAVGWVVGIVEHARH